jgi:hypothetical protein
MTPSGLEPTPARGFQALRVCPHCRKPLPPVAYPSVPHGALEPKPGTEVNRAAEFEDATPTVPQPVDRRVAETERIQRS